MAAVEPAGFGLVLRRLRRDAGLTQEELAERAGLSVRGISDLERGARRAPHRDTVRLLAEALGLTVEGRSTLEEAARTYPNGALRRHLPVGGFLGALPVGLMVARDAELLRLRAAVEAVSTNAGRLVMLAGELGIGKTRLAQEVTLHLRERGFLVAAGRCYEPESAIPYFPWMDALTTAFTGAPRAIRAEAPRRWPFLGRLLPDLVRAEGVIQAPGPEDQQWLFRAIGGFLDALAAVVPVALLLDDLHWADGASISLLLHLARHLRGSRVFLLGTYRELEVGRQHPLEGALHDLSREGLVEPLVLRPLDEAGTAALVANTLGEEMVDERLTELVHRRTEGNPFFVQQVMRSMVERGDLSREEGRWQQNVAEIEVPESVRAVIGRRLARLADGTQETLREASVLGQAFSFADLCGMSRSTEAELDAALDEARGAGLLRDGEQDHYLFDHALTQQTLYAEMSRRRRGKLHLAAGQMLERLPASEQEGRLGEIAWHYLHSDESRRALPYALRAGDHARAVFALPEAETQYRIAAQLAAQLGDVSLEAQALEKLGDVVKTLGRYDEAIEILQRSASLFRSEGDVEREGRASISIASAVSGKGSYEEAVERVRAAIDLLESIEPTASLVEAYASLAWLSTSVGHASVAMPPLERAMELARSFGLDSALGRLIRRQAIKMNSVGRREEAVQLREEAIRLAEKSGDLFTLGSLYNEAAGECRARGDMGRAEECARMALDAATRLGDPAHNAYMASSLGVVLWERGDWSQARELLERAVTTVRSIDSPLVVSHCKGWLGKLLTEQGDEAAGEAVLKETESIPLEASNWPRSAAALWLAEHYRLRGQPEECLRRLDILRADPGIAPGWIHDVEAERGMALLDLGRLQEAAAVLPEAVQRMIEIEQPLFFTLLARRSLALLSIRTQQLDSAQAILEDILAITRRAGLPFYEAQALNAFAQLDAARGDIEHARGRCDDALLMFRRLGAMPYVRAVEELRTSLRSGACESGELR